MSLTPEELAAMVSEAESERIKELKRALVRADRRIDQLTEKTEDLVAAVYQAVEDNMQLLELRTTPAPTLPPVDASAEVAVVMLSDWQLHKRTPDYDAVVCERRIEAAAEKIIRITNVQRADHPVNELRVWLLGDLIEGELIFPGQAHQISGSLFRQVTIDGPRILGNFLRRMLGEFDVVHVAGVLGNHGAIGGRSRRDMHPETNADRMLYHIVQQIMEAAGEARLTWNLPFIENEAAWYTVEQIGSYSSLLFHGHQIKNYNTFPWYGFNRKVLGWKALGANKVFPMPDFQDGACGHFHTPTQMYMNGIFVRVNGTTESYNTYAEESLAAMGEPSQRLMFVHPERGIVTAEYLLRLGDA